MQADRARKTNLILVGQARVRRDSVLIVRLGLDFPDLVQAELGEGELLVTFADLHVQVDQTLP